MAPRQARGTGDEGPAGPEAPRQARGPEDVVARRTAVWVVVVAGAIFVVLAWWLIPWDWLPGGKIEPVRASEVFTPEQIARAERYSGQSWTISWWSLGVSLAVAAVLGLTRWGAKLVRSLPGPWWAQVCLGAFIVMLLGELATLPFGWKSYQLNLDYGLTTQGTAGWFRDRGTSFFVSWVFNIAGLLVVVGLARRLPRRWPAVAAVVAGALVILGSFVYPLTVEPLFNNFHSMQRGPLRAQILELAKREHVDIDDVLVADASRRTTRLNAYVSGIGSTKRVVVYDTLLEGLPRDQVLVVVAHELGHTKHRDVLVGTFLGAFGAAMAVGLLGLVLSTGAMRRRADITSIADPGAVPLLLLLATVATLLSAPVQNTMSRAVEARADRTSLDVTAQYDPFIAMQHQLALHSLADPTPQSVRQIWFGSHPTSLQRIALAKAMRAQ